MNFKCQSLHAFRFDPHAGMRKIKAVNEFSTMGKLYNEEMEWILTFLKKMKRYHKWNTGLSNIRYKKLVPVLINLRNNFFKSSNLLLQFKLQ